MTERRHWWVYSPEWDEMEPILDDGTGPSYATCDAVCVEAATKRQAIVSGVRRMPRWPEMARGDDCNPYSGVVAEEAKCKHGVCHCDLCYEEGGGCQECEEEESRQLPDWYPGVKGDPLEEDS